MQDQEYITKGRTEDNPVEKLEEFMLIFNQMIKELKDDSTINPIENDLILFRGMATDKFDIVGRINEDLKNVKKDFHYDNPVENVEKELLNNFMQRARIFQKILPKDEWEWIALARHHGVPTRILDWSRDPQVALWFAVQDEKSFMHDKSVFYIFYPSKKYKIQHGGELFNTEKDENITEIDGKKSYLKYKYHDFKSPFNIDNTHREIILYRPSSLNLRIDYQSSWFTVHPFVDGEYKPLPKPEKNICLRKIYISNQRTQSIRTELGKLGIDTASVYKDLDSIGKYLKEKRFKQNDDIFTVDMMMPKKIHGTFQQLQGIVGLYNSPEVKSIEFLNIKGLYNQLISVLSDKNKTPVSLLTFNNMNREFLAYRNQRELFLRLIESHFKNGNFTYRRIQFYNLIHEIEKLNTTNNSINIDELGYKRLFENIMVWTDGLSKNHVQSCEKIKELTTKYLLINDPTFNLCGFCIIKTIDETKEYTYYLIVEFNHDYLNKIIGQMQNMAFLLEFNPTINAPDIIKAYEMEFESLFNKTNLTTDWKYKIFNFKEAEQTIKIKKNELSNSLPTDYVKINIYDWESEETISPEKNIVNRTDILKDGKWYAKFKTELLVPVENCNKRIESIHSLLDYIYFKVRSNHPLCILRDFSYGKSNDWYLSVAGDEISGFENSLSNISLEMRKTHYSRYYYSEKIANSNKIKPGASYDLEYGDEFNDRVEKLKEEENNKAKTK